MTATAWPSEYGSHAQAAALHSLLSEEVSSADSSTWKNTQDTQWGDLLAMGSEAFTRALVQAEHELDQHTRSIGGGGGDGDSSEANGVRCTPASDAQAPLDSTAFQQWAQRIAQLQIFDVDDALRLSAAEEEEHEAKYVESIDPSLSAAASFPPSELTVDQQLLRLKLQLAQEEARSVHLEDRLSRCLFELDSERNDCAALRASNAALTSRNLQHSVSNTQGCEEGCGLVRLERDRMVKQNEALTAQLRTIEQQTAQLVRQIEAQAIAAAASTPTSAARSSPAAAAAAPSPATPVRLPAFIATAASAAGSAPVAAAAVPSTPAAPSSAVASAAASASSISLLRVRSSLALARSTLRHQGEVSHLIRYKLEALNLQSQLDDLEAALDSEREQAAADAAELVRTRADLVAKSEQEQGLQAVVASLAQQLQKLAGSRGLGVSVSMLSPSPAAALTLTTPQRSTPHMDDAAATAAGATTMTESQLNRINVLPAPIATPSPAPAAATAAASVLSSPPPAPSSSVSASAPASASASTSAAPTAATSAAVHAGLMTPPRRMPPLHSPYYAASATPAATPAATASAFSTPAAAPSSSPSWSASAAAASASPAPAPAPAPLTLTTTTPAHGRSESSASTTSSSGGGWSAGYWFGAGLPGTGGSSSSAKKATPQPQQQAM